MVIAEVDEGHAPPLPGEDGLDGAVPPELVHKVEQRHGWLTASTPNGEDAIDFGYRLPGDLRPGAAEYVEVQRQATHALAHLLLRVPFESRAMLSSADLVFHGDEPGEAAPRAGRARLRTRVDGRAVRGVAHIDVGAEFFAGNDAPSGACFATGRITGKYLPQRLYDRLRTAAAPAASKAAAESGVTDPAAPEHETAASALVDALAVEELVVDRSNPILADHETDHVDGMAVVCASEEMASRFMPGRRLRGITTRFIAFIEKAEPARLAVRQDGERLIVSVVQRGAVRAETVMRFDEAGDREDQA
ncbi:hypothetical protein [Leucobacter massiliensis]|uniref:A-factor biosynthesis hotdog domain-containing protein n=1 Tax=Leucobacter massiliensis TaxID=1686285 RepID=A0A2S9QNQ1_9MICO|nr:hypothetical protein [Leucobacter massiliensis]PRI11225.1 hypothetical protein B4915_10270 [Leucobacter massiliensis]